MKRGAGDDPFADDATDDPAPGSNADGEDPDARSPVSQPSTASGDRTVPGTRPADDLPYLARRQLRDESVKADRDQVPFFLRSEVQRGERDLRRAVEDRLGQEVNKTDLREAAYVFAQRHPEDVVEILREWGIEYLE